MLSSLSILPPDPLWGLTTAFRQDERPGKMDLVVGVYRDEFGRTPVLSAVQAAERRLAEGGLSKAYRSLSGNAAFNAGMARLLLGTDAARLARQHAMQTVGGTGALRLLADFIALANPEAQVWSTDPGYVNHRPLMEAAGLTVSTYRWRETAQGLDTDVMLADLDAAKRGDIVIVHGCCHNPTGIDMPFEAWAAVTGLCARKGLVPLVDMAYQGFGDGLEADAAGLRHMIDRLETVLVAASCSKNMGLYCERTGSASVVGPDTAALRPVAGTLERITRSNYSMPPEHGAAIATQLFDDPEPWHAELEAMRLRVVSTRILLADALYRFGAPERFQSLRRHKGMFSLLPVTCETMTRLREEFAIYGTRNGRINIAGLRPDQVENLARALVCLSRDREAA
ncbi:MAG TPA: amino acid aminotransferase [Alphaproteobacteria bacterium]|nr:amino acid aminotransferase [Alphaproteobacteria bacterium]